MIGEIVSSNSFLIDVHLLRRRLNRFRPRPGGRPAALDVPARAAVAGGLTRRRGDGLVRLLHVDGSPVVVAVSGQRVRGAGGL